MLQKFIIIFIFSDVSSMTEKKTSQKKIVTKEVRDSASEVKRAAPVVRVTDFSAGKIKASLVASFVALLFLAVFPYKNITREHGSYSLLLEYYSQKIENRFFVEESLALRSAPIGTATSVPIVMYHGVMARPDAYNLHRKNFEDHLLTLKTAGWETISMDEFRAFRKGQISLPQKSFLLTFDDGRKDSYYPVDQLLARFGYSAVMFTLPQYSIDHEALSPYYLNKNHIEKMHASGRWDIESHSWDGHSFFPLVNGGEDEGIFFANLLWRDDLGRVETQEEFRLRVRADLVKADNSVRTLTQKPVSTIAFPFGNYGNVRYNFANAQSIVLEEAQKVHDFGFTQVRTGIFNGHGLSGNYANPDDFLVERIDVNPLWSAAELLGVVEAGMDKSLPYASDMTDYIGWIAPRGVARHAQEAVVLETSQIHPQAVSFLDGGGLWEDYRVDLDVQWDSGEKLVLRTHGALADGGVACVFARDQMYVVTEGVSRDVVRVAYADATTRDRVTVSAQATDTGGVCRIGDTTLPFVLDAGQTPLTAGTVSVEVHAAQAQVTPDTLLTPLTTEESANDALDSGRQKGKLTIYSLSVSSLTDVSEISLPLTSLEYNL